MLNAVFHLIVFQRDIVTFTCWSHLTSSTFSRSSNPSSSSASSKSPSSKLKNMDETNNVTNLLQNKAVINIISYLLTTKIGCCDGTVAPRCTLLIINKPINIKYWNSLALLTYPRCRTCFILKGECIKTFFPLSIVCMFEK